MRAPSERLVFKTSGVIAADMSASQATDCIPRPTWSTQACIGIGWTAPAGQEPTGTLVIKLVGNTADTDGATYPSAHSSPAASSVGQIITVNMGASPGVIVSYTRTSLGAGAVFTGATVTSGTYPTITWR